MNNGGHFCNQVRNLCDWKAQDIFEAATSNTRAHDQGDPYGTVLETFEGVCLTILVVISLDARSMVSFPGAV